MTRHMNRPVTRTEAFNYAMWLMVNYAVGDDSSSSTLECLGWKFYFTEEFTGDGRIILGCTYPAEKAIVLSLKALELLDRRQVYDTLRHEAAHALAAELHGSEIELHGPEFRAVARELKCTQSGFIKAPKKKAA